MNIFKLKELIPKDSIIVSEGANTMDTSRSILMHSQPRHRLVIIFSNLSGHLIWVYIINRLDAGSFGTMGVGSGFAIAAALYCRDHQPGKRVFCIQGDSAFGFGGMEIETAYRF